MPESPFILTQPTINDAHAIAKFIFSAYGTDPASAVLYSIPASKESIQWTADFITSSWGRDPGARPICLKDRASGEIVCYASYGISRPSSDPKYLEWNEKNIPLNPHMNRERMLPQLRRHWEAKRDLMHGKTCLYLVNLMTSPDHRRLGLANRLLDWGKALAAVHNIPIYLHGYYTAVPLYEKAGFRSLRHVPQPLPGFPDRHSLAMVYDAAFPSSPPLGLPKVDGEIVASIGTGPKRELSLIHPSKSDVKALADLQHATYSFTPNSKESIEWTQEHLARTIGLSPDTYPICFKDTTSGEIASYAEYELYRSTNDSKQDRPKYDRSRVNPYSNRKLILKLRQQLREAQNEIMREHKAYLFLDYLVTAPSHRRQGLANHLLQWGISFCTTYNIPFLLFTISDAMPLYQKAGFQPVHAIPQRVPSDPDRITTAMIYSSTLFPSSPPLLGLLPKPLDRITIQTSTAANAAEDAAQFIHYEDICFANERFSNLCFPKPDDLIVSYKHRVENYTKEMRDDAANYLVQRAVDVYSGAIAGMIRWRIFDGPDEESRVDEPYDEKIWPPGVCLPLANAMFGELTNQRMERMKGMRYMFLFSLMVAPEWQRKGIGEELCKGGLREADRRGVAAWVDASDMGLELYKRLGWVEEGRVEVDEGVAESMGGVKGEKLITAYLVRPAKGDAEGVSEKGTIGEGDGKKGE
ncbi:hypothetical protein MMC25_007667 [Agyrium rufum]|nr:hypothetical protein [Agyrium rufum]